MNLKAEQDHSASIITSTEDRKTTFPNLHGDDDEFDFEISLSSKQENVT